MKKKKILFGIGMICIVYILFELLCSLSLFYIRKVKKTYYTPIRIKSLSQKHKDAITRLLREETGYACFHPVLGWSIKKNGRSELYNANSQGIRGDREYELNPPQNKIRIAAFGNSFTHCDDVKNEDTWQEYINRSDKHIEVLNFGVGGYSPDQAYLRYLEDGAAFNPHIVLMCMAGVNVFRNVNVYKPFMWDITGIPLSKPRFILKGDSLVFLENPMKELSDYKKLLIKPEKLLRQMGEHDYFFLTKYKESSFDFLPSVRLFTILHYKLIKEKRVMPFIHEGYFNTDSEAYRVTAAIFKQFAASAKSNGALPIAVIFPHRGDFEQFKNDGTRVYEPFLKEWHAQDCRYIDLLDAFIEYDKDYTLREEIGWGHYTPQANEIVAKYILEYLYKNSLIPYKNDTLSP